MAKITKICHRDKVSKCCWKNSNRRAQCRADRSLPFVKKKKIAVSVKCNKMRYDCVKIKTFCTVEGKQK